MVAADAPTFRIQFDGHRAVSGTSPRWTRSASRFYHASMAIDLTRALDRSINIARLNRDTFEEVEADTSSTTEAGAVVVATSILGSLGTLFTNGLWGFLAMIVASIVGWIVWSWAAAEIATRHYKVPTTDRGEMQRVIGYGSAPRVLGVIPFLGLISFIWTCIVLVTGIRQAGEMTTGPAIVTAVVGLIPTLIATGLILTLL